ncbi:TetR/AcrR family transcriptional regulator [Oceanobacillus halophilus]|uniref:TetR/AcrR family transcriptional regulator n=1 Tax=Oceanobacillus halophilus TaxID=930130 RepID=A0A495A3A0_9BACI|nr:TetR family transcriptional regulator [Oceanobacillus halophilus]RKQ33564.1 TetR/AcrR family transcriptional regulator [Oceanobacillus halophilus]
MPKRTFFNLPEQKRQNLMQAAEEEFAKSPLYEASISNIVKSAGIPRGSFYQYFEDKEDVYFYLLKEETKTRKIELIDKLKKHHGDIIDAVIDMYYEFLVDLPDDQELNFLKNALLNVTHKIEDAVTSMFEDSHSNDYMEQINRLIDKERLNIEDDQQIYHILQIIVAVAFRNFVEKFSKELSDKEAIENFSIEMQLLKNGLYRN